ncbi:MAG TPA: glycoside hydrolase family 3 N-terminal domain-containing protein, partial [Gammaproteobacteria bacterium]|nr:glycoside hydrolase family 3 N-terminal domain-containing protein [Gammaproteobacteria bacterium]
MQRRDFLSRAAICGAAGTLAWRNARGQRAARRRTGVGGTRLDAAARAVLEQMTLDEKLGQMAQAELNRLERESDVERYFLGSVLSGGDADPKAGNGLVAWTDAIDALIERSMHTRLRIPILYGVDAVHGHSNVEGATIFPHNIGLGCTRNPALVEDIGKITALEMRATGAQWAFAPCVATPRDERWGRTYEGFSESPDVAAELGAAAVFGLQGGGRARGASSPASGLASPRSVLACAKHYVGDGGTSYEPRELPGGRTTLLDQGDTRVDEATLRRIHLPAYVTAIEA